MQVLEGRQTAAGHLLSSADDTLQPALVLGSGSSVPDDAGGGEDRLNDGCVEVYRHCLWQVELLRLPQEVHPLLCFLGEGADVQFPLEVLGEDSAQEAEGLHSVDWEVTQGDRAEWGWALSEIHNR